MDFWKHTPYEKWYLSHRRFSFTSKFCIELYEENKNIPDIIFKPFLKSLKCHSTNEEKNIFKSIEIPDSLFHQHDTIQITKDYTNEEKYIFCKSLLNHMKEEEAILKIHIER